MREYKNDVMKTFFDDEALSIIYSLVHRKNPAGRAEGDDDVFKPTISATLHVLSELMEESTPDLYKWEWDVIAHALDRVEDISRLPSSAEAARARLVLSVEDADLKSGGLDGLELSKKLAGLSNSEVFAVFWKIQKCLVAESRGEPYAFPEIPFRG